MYIKKSLLKSLQKKKKTDEGEKQQVEVLGHWAVMSEFWEPFSGSDLLSEFSGNFSASDPLSEFRRRSAGSVVDLLRSSLSSSSHFGDRRREHDDFTERCGSAPDLCLVT